MVMFNYDIMFLNLIAFFIYLIVMYIVVFQHILPTLYVNHKLRETRLVSYYDNVHDSYETILLSEITQLAIISTCLILNNSILSKIDDNIKHIFTISNSEDESV